MTQLHYTQFDSPIGQIGLLGHPQSGLQRLIFINHTKTAFKPPSSWQMDETCFLKAQQQLRMYFNGKLQQFDLKLAPEGTAFQQKVWQALMNVPYAQTRSYKDIAQTIGSPNGFRAVGLANARNPLPIIVPCHRIVGSNGQLTGYAYGVELKKHLLDLEQKNSLEVPPLN